MTSKTKRPMQDCARPTNRISGRTTNGEATERRHHWCRAQRASDQKQSELSNRHTTHPSTGLGPVPFLTTLYFSPLAVVVMPSSAACAGGARSPPAAAVNAISCSTRRRETGVAPPAAAGAAIRSPEAGQVTAAEARAPRRVGRPLSTKAAMAKEDEETTRRKTTMPIN